MKSGSKFDAWLFTLFAMPLFLATLSTAAANVFGVLFLITYAFSGYWRNWRQIVLRPWFWPLMALLAINILGMLWTQDIARGLELLVKLKWALFTLAGATLPWKRSNFITLVRLFLAGLALNAFIGILQLLHIIDWLHKSTEFTPIGLTDRIFLSMTLTSAIIWLAYDIKHLIVFSRAVNVILALLFFIQLVLAGGRAGQVSFVLLFPTALWMLSSGRWRIWAMVIGMLGIAGLYFSPQVQSRIEEAKSDLALYQSGIVETSVGGRLVLWEGALKMAMDHPILGVGTGDFKNEMARLQQLKIIPETPINPVNAHAHNSYLTYLAGLGITGLFVLLWFLWAASLEAWQNRKNDAAWFKLAYMGIFLLGSFSDTLIWGFHNAFALGLIVAIPPVIEFKLPVFNTQS